METMIRMSLTTKRMGRMSRTPFPRGLSSEIIVISVSERRKDDFTAFSFIVSILSSHVKTWINAKNAKLKKKSLIRLHHNYGCLSEDEIFFKLQTKERRWSLHSGRCQEMEPHLSSFAATQSHRVTSVIKQIVCHLYIAWRSHLYGLMLHLYHRNRQADSESCRYGGVFIPVMNIM